MSFGDVFFSLQQWLVKVEDTLCQRQCSKFKVKSLWNYGQALSMATDYKNISWQMKTKIYQKQCPKFKGYEIMTKHRVITTNCKNIASNK